MLSFSTYTDSQFRSGTLTSSFFSHPISSRRFEPQRINIGNNRCYHLKCGLVRAKGSLSRNPATIVKEPHKYFEQVIITVDSIDRGHGAILSMPNQRGPSKSRGKHDEELRKKSLYERDCDGSLVLPMVGHGGDVVIYVDEGKDSLMKFHKKSRYNAKRGGNVDAIGVLTSLLRDGLAVFALHILVPPGTVVKHKQQKLLADLHPGDEVLIVKSGQGGINFLEILEHEEKKLMALTTNVMRDENVKGLPNAGKSSLLAAITIAKPDIVSYPFTTLMPNLGRPDADPNLGSRRYAYEEATLTNLPGVIESADLGPCGKDLAHNFWRHLRRTRLSVHVCHASAEDPVNDFRTVKEAKELSSVDAVESSSEIPKDKKIGSSAQNSTKIKKSTPKSGLRRSRNRRIGSRKTVQRRIPKGVIHVQASFNNTIVTVTDIRGQVVSWSSAGTSGFKGTRRGTPFAAQTAAQNALRTVVSQGMQRAEVLIKGPGLGRDAALRAIRRSGIQLSFVRDVTPLAHNGCRPPKKRRV